jgi:hypothetical protein
MCKDAKPPRVTTCKRCQSAILLIGKRGPAPSLCQQCRAEVGSFRVFRVDCKQCGRTSWKSSPQEFCSNSCCRSFSKEKAARKPCKHCGASFPCTEGMALNGRSYCNDACRIAEWSKNKEQRSCAQCGKSFIVRRVRPGRREKNKYCSRPCAIAARNLSRASKASRVRLIGLFRKLQRRYKKALRDKQIDLRRKALRPCVRCGKMFRDGDARLCSVECRKESRRINKRSGKKKKTSRTHADRCAIRGLPFDSEITKQFVHERDQYKCLLCGQQTIAGDKSMAPHLGHIVPLNNPMNITHGHVANNTFTNCARCNSKQGNAVVIDGHQNYADPRAAYMNHVERLGYPFSPATLSPPSPDRVLR